jgi:hypothetical protein
LKKRSKASRNKVPKRLREAKTFKRDNLCEKEGKDGNGKKKTSESSGIIFKG